LCYMPYPCHYPWLDHSNYTLRRVQVMQVMKLIIMQFSPASCHVISLVPIFSSTPSVYVPPLMSETMFHTHAEPQAKL
jgi:hypothetical protein